RGIRNRRRYLRKRVVWQGFPCCSSLWLRARALVAVRVNRKRRAAKTLPRSRGTQGRTTYPPREPNGPRGKSNKGRGEGLASHGSRTQTTRCVETRMSTGERLR